MIKRTAFILSLILGLACASRGQVMMLFTADSLSYITSPLGIDSLFYWFDASQGVTDSLGGAIATDEGVGTWEDLSPNGYDVTQTTNGMRPIYKATGGPGSKPCFQFDGVDDHLISSSHWWGSDDVSIFVVAKHNNATLDEVERYIFRDTPGEDNRQWRLETRGNTTFSYSTYFLTSPDGTSATSQIKYGGAKSTAWRIICGVSNGVNTKEIFLDGVSQSLTSSNTDYTIHNYSQPVTIGQSTTVSLLGSMCEIIVYSKALTAAERGAIENYLNKKYDLY